MQTEALTYEELSQLVLERRTTCRGLAAKNSGATHEQKRAAAEEWCHAALILVQRSSADQREAAKTQYKESLKNFSTLPKVTTQHAPQERTETREQRAARLERDRAYKAARRARQHAPQERVETVEESNASLERKREYNKKHFARQKREAAENPGGLLLPPSKRSKREAAFPHPSPVPEAVTAGSDPVRLGSPSPVSWAVAAGSDPVRLGSPSPVPGAVAANPPTGRDSPSRFLA